jgi:hypothetical protein
VTDLHRLQTTAHHELIARLKLHATKRGQPLTELYEEALTHLLTERATFRRQGRSVQYFLAPRNERRLYLRIPRRLAKFVSSAARADAVNPDSFAYTALFSYEVGHVFPIPKNGISFLFLLMNSEPMIPDRPIGGERRPMPIPPSPSERRDRASTDLDNIHKLIEELWLYPPMQYAALREFQLVQHQFELATRALAGGEP